MSSFYSVRSTTILAVMVWIGTSLDSHAGVNYEEAPINYSKTEPLNAVSRLQTRIDEAAVILKFDESQGYLRSLLDALVVPLSSQVLTFGKTSLQSGHVTPATPRAIYFNDEVHVGYVQNGLIEVAVADPRLGMAFYTLEQIETEKPRLRQTSNNCLTCHGAARTRNVPGLQVRSVFPDAKGQPVIAAGSVRTDHSTPLEKRWGGWYVTGRHGTQPHLGNFTLTDDKKPKFVDNASGLNITDLSTRFDTSKYLTPHSDIVALMVLEHQADTYNLITVANYESRYALYVRSQLLQQTDAKSEEIHKKTLARIASAGEPLVRSLLFSGEAALKEPIEGTGNFSHEFMSRLPVDRHGRSLRDFDLQVRMFKYPCSYLIYTPAFDALPQEMKDFVFRRIRLVLTTGELKPEYTHLSSDDRVTILEILTDTKPDFANFVKTDADSQVTR